MGLEIISISQVLHFKSYFRLLPLAIEVKQRISPERMLPVVSVADEVSQAITNEFFSVLDQGTVTKKNIPKLAGLQRLVRGDLKHDNWRIAIRFAEHLGLNYAEFQQPLFKENFREWVKAHCLSKTDMENRQLLVVEVAYWLKQSAHEVRMAGKVNAVMGLIEKQ